MGCFLLENHASKYLNQQRKRFIMGVQPKIGLEIHGYLVIPSQKKLFCNCSLAPADPNTQICPVCTAQPGSKPMLPNRQAVEAILKIAMFLECNINEALLWQRKHYSWPDLPSGYQRTMSGAYSQPVGLNGSFLGIGIEEIHLEEDPARYDPANGTVDYNRSGYPLVEIVTKPDFTSSQQVRDWIENLMVALSYIKAVRKDLGVKCDVNVSIGPKFIRTEVKNVNSFSAIVESIEFEIKRQQIEEAKQQTRAWDEKTGTTLFMRSKETAMDYMFIPDPDLPVIHITDNILQPIREALPERPDQKQVKFEKLGLDKIRSEKLSKNLFFANYAEQISEKQPQVPFSFIADRFINEIASAIIFEGNPISIKHIESIIVAFHARDIDNQSMKALLALVSKGNPEALAEIEHTLKSSKHTKQSDDEILPLVKTAIEANPKAADDVRKGNDKAINAIVGHVLGNLKKQGKTADPAVIQKIVRENL